MNSPVLLIAIPLLMAFLSTIIKKLEKGFLGLAILANLTCLYFVEKGSYFIGGFKPPFGINLVLDDYSFLGVFLLNIIFALALFLSFKSIGKYSVILLVSLASLNGMILTGDLFNLFVFIEIASISAYILSSISKKYKFSFNYLVIGTLGSGLYLFGVIIFYNIFGSLNMEYIAERIVNSNISSNALLLPMVLIFTGLAVEAKILPFNGWVKGVLGNANGLVGSIFAAAYPLTIMLVFGRLMTTVFIISEELKFAFLFLAIATMVLAEFAAFSKKSLREILLFSSIAQSGLIAALFLFNFTYAALAVLLNNVVAKLIMFTIAGKIADENGTDNLEDLKGLFAKYKLIGFGFTISAMSIIGLPLFYGFYTKISVLMSLVEANNLWLPAVILFVSVIEGAYFIRILTKLWNPAEEGSVAVEENVTEVTLINPTLVGVVVALIGVLILVTGILPNIVADNLQTITESLNSDVPSFISNFIGGM